MSNQTKKPPMGGMGPGKGPMTMEEENDKIDPRWDELRKLINNN